MEVAKTGASPTASVESIFNVIKIIVEEGGYKILLDIGGLTLMRPSIETNTCGWIHQWLKY